MFGLRSKRTTRDRRIGLVFQWRLPVSSRMTFLSAIALVALLSAGLAATVRVRVGGGGARHPERRGSLVIVPQGDDWQFLRILALEAGPFPAREDPSRDPAVVALVRESMAAADIPGYRYQPVFQHIPVAEPASPSLIAGQTVPVDLPPLPEPEAPPADALPRTALKPVVLAADGLRALPPAAPPPAGVVQGNRYLLGYDPAGRVLRVITISGSQEAAADTAAVESWLRQIAIEGGEKSGGWAAVEISDGA
jgi:hypothetical protein